MLTLNDGRAELWQWDTGRTLAVDADCSQVHFSNKVFGRSIDVDVVGGSAIIPDILLQTDKDLNVWAFVGTAENGYTKISKTFKVNRRNKPADYVFTQTDQMTLQTIKRQIGDLSDLTTEAKDTLVAAINEAARTGGGGGSSTVELDATLTQSGQAADAKATGDALRSLSAEIANLQTGGLTTAQVNALDGMFKVAAYIKADVSAEYSAFKTAFGIDGSGDTEPEKTLTSISATYSGGSVPAGTVLDALTGIVVTAQYSDGSTETVTGYTLSGTIAEGSNTITVSYGGMTTTFSVTGIAESSGNPFAGTWTEGFRLQANGKEFPTGHANYDTTDYVDCTNFNTVTISTEVDKNETINAVVWYDSNKTYISGSGVDYIRSTSDNYPSSRSYTKPDGAAYCRLCVLGASDGYRDFIISVE